MVVTAIELLSGIPSVVFGLLGMQVLVPAMAKTFGKASGACLLSAIVVLSIMILPSIVSVSVTALNAVPPEYEQGSLALVPPTPKHGSRSAFRQPKAALPQALCWASAVPSARPWR